MPKLTLRINPSPAGLLREAADAANGYRLDGVLLALRQGGLRDDLYAMAGAAGHPGWFDPPVCVFHELPERLGATNRIPLTGDERAVLLERLMREHGGQVFARLRRLPEFVDAIETLVGETTAEGVTAALFTEAAERADVAEPWDRERNTALAGIYQAYHRELSGDPARLRRDGRDTFADIALAIEADPDGLRHRLAGRRELRILGLTDLRGGWRSLLGVLRRAESLDRLEVFALDDHLLAEGLVADETVRSEPPAPPAITVLRAPDTDREVEEVAVRVRRLVEQGVPPTRIAVVSRKARPHVDLVLAALARAGVPATARRRIGYREIPVVKSLVTLLQAAAEGWTRHGLAELAGQPYFASRLDRRVLDFLGYRSGIAGLEEWEAAIGRLVAQAEAREAAEEPEDERRGWIPTANRARNARDRFAGFATVAAQLDDNLTLAQWVGWLEKFLDDDPWGVEQRIRKIPTERWEVARVDLAGWRALRETARGWREGLERWGTDTQRLDAEQFLIRLGTVLAGDAALWTTCRRGVAVVEGLAAAYRHFEHLFVVGLEAGRFPTRRPRSPILHEEDRLALKAAGLPFDAEALWEARELSLFRALLAAGTQVCLSHGVLDASGREVLGSAFLEDVKDRFAVTEEAIETSRVLTPGLPLFADPAVAGHALTAATIESVRETGAPNPWNGLIEDPALRAELARRFGEDYIWSPTQLESYAKCPWSWFSARLLKLEKLEDPDQQIDASLRGTLWHAALERFWGAAAGVLKSSARTGEGRMLGAPDLEWARPLLADAVDAAWAAAGEGAWLGHPALHDVTLATIRNTLIRYLEWEVQLNEDAYKSRGNARETLRTAVEAHELKFDNVLLEHGGIRLIYRGSIDRVEVGVDERVPSAGFVAAVDYKSSKWGTPGGGAKKAWGDRVVLQVPLYAHALMQLMTGSKVSRVEYRAIRQPTSVHALHLVTVAKSGKGHGLEADPEAAALMKSALVAATEHVASVRSGQYPARYVDSCKCPSFCAAWDICRVRGGPQGMF